MAKRQKQAKGKKIDIVIKIKYLKNDLCDI